MFSLNTVSLEKAQGFVKEVYDKFPEQLGIPGPLEIFSASPGLFKQTAGFLGYYNSQENLKPEVLAVIRLCAASKYGLQTCVDFNTKMLTLIGMTPDELLEIVKDPEKAPFEAKEKALIGFVLAAVDDPDTDTQKKVAELKKMGWTDQDIFDATMHCTLMINNVTIYRIFKNK